MTEVLIMAMTRMRSGICTAGFVSQPHPRSGLAWVRPVKEFGAVLLGDMTDGAGRVVQVNDVVDLHLVQHRPDGPHAEDWITDFLHRRPRLLRRLEGEKRARFLVQHVDSFPSDVLLEHRRSLCLVQAQDVWADFRWDRYSNKYKARLGFRLPDAEASTLTQGGLLVTDLAWRALGREWLNKAEESFLHLSPDELLGQLGADAIFLSLGLARQWRGDHWPLVVGVHPTPDYTVAIDYNNL